MKDVAIEELVVPALFFFLKIAWLFSVSPISIFNIFFATSLPQNMLLYFFPPIWDFGLGLYQIGKSASGEFAF